MLFMITEIADTSNYVAYRTPTMTNNNSITSKDEEILFTWLIIIASIYDLWYFSKDKSKNR